ncbi:hypothetical protein [Brenneria alni]|nr:hypothetical protein [Brenneria alni]
MADNLGNEVCQTGNLRRHLHFCIAWLKQRYLNIPSTPYRR